jgi:selenide,water dikinase
MYEKGETTGSNGPNRKAAEGFWELEARLSGSEQELLFDPQTSGGLLFAVPGDQAGPLIRGLRSAGVSSAARIGEVSAGDRPLVSVG